MSAERVNGFIEAMKQAFDNLDTYRKLQCSYQYYHNTKVLLVRCTETTTGKIISRIITKYHIFEVADADMAHIARIHAEDIIDKLLNP